jgi:hypothetical protein
LVTTVNSGLGFQVVQFSHFSVKEFLTSERLASSSGNISRYHVDLKTAHTFFAQACLAVLLRLNDQVSQDNPQDIPLSQYAVPHWVYHAQFENVSSSMRDTIECFFDTERRRCAWFRFYDKEAPWYWFGPVVDTGGGPLYYAALCGFHDLVEHLAANHLKDVNAEGGRNRPHWWQRCIGSTSILQRYSIGTVRTSMFGAASHSHHSMLQPLTDESMLRNSKSLECYSSAELTLMPGLKMDVVLYT